MTPPGQICLSSNHSMAFHGNASISGGDDPSTFRIISFCGILAKNHLKW
jgi:hypothetical protein